VPQLREDRNANAAYSWTLSLRAGDMTAPQTAFFLRYPEDLADSPLDDFVKSIEDANLTVTVDRRKHGPYAGHELLVSTVVVVTVLKSYFDGFLNAAGADHYATIKKACGKLWASLAKVTFTSVASSLGKISNGPYSIAFSVSVGGGGREIKLVVRKDATPEQVEAAVGAFFALLEEAPRWTASPFPMNGGVALVSYDETSGTIVAVNLDR
jgi:hypothetical protein